MSVGLERGSEATRKAALERSTLAIAPTRRRWNLRLAAMGVGLAAGGALLFVSLLLVNSGTDVLAAARAVPLGHVFQASDFRTVRVKVFDGSMDAVSAVREDSVIGHAAAVPLNAGQVIPQTAIGPAASVPAGEAVVGISLKPGQFPSGLSQGEHVWVVSTTATPPGPTPGVTEMANPIPATVLATEVLGDDPQASTVLSLLLGSDQAAQVAAMAASGQVSLVLVPPSGGQP